jgi:hypothetical protein
MHMPAPQLVAYAWSTAGIRKRWGEQQPAMSLFRQKSIRTSLAPKSQPPVYVGKVHLERYKDALRDPKVREILNKAATIKANDTTQSN